MILSRFENINFTDLLINEQSSTFLFKGIKSKLVKFLILDFYKNKYKTFNFISLWNFHVDTVQHACNYNLKQTFHSTIKLWNIAVSKLPPSSYAV